MRDPSQPIKALILKILEFIIKCSLGQDILFYSILISFGEEDLGNGDDRD
jgi:hypothetical protein